MGNKPNIKAGVLIIGSLFWDINHGRRPWREHAFGENFHQHVIRIKVPIKYGRYSVGRECPTMTLSMEYHKSGKLGTGLFIPFKNQKQNLGDIICSARDLSQAEGKHSRDFIKGRDDPWCVIVYCANPKFEGNETMWEAFNSAWNYDPDLSTVRNQFKCNCEEEPVFDISGGLPLLWPEELDDFDLILTTQPKPTDCYSVETLAYMFFNKPEYFMKNRLNNIETDDDESIINLLKQKDLNIFRKNAAYNCSKNEIEDFFKKENLE